MTDNAGWIIDVDVKMREKRAFTKALANIANITFDEGEVFPFFVKFIKAWPWPGDPSKLDTYDDLSQSQYDEVMQRVQAAFQLLRERPK